MSSYPPNPLPGVPTSLSISPVTATLGFGDTLQLTAALADAYGSPVEPSQPFTYTSTNPGLLTVDSSGLCTAASPDPSVLTPGGQATVTASYQLGTNTLSASSVVTVTGTPAKTQTVVLLDSNQYGITNSTVTASKVVPETAPAGVYPSGWVIASNNQ